MEQQYLFENEKWISAFDKKIHYCGRIDFTDDRGPIMYYPSSNAAFRFSGTSCKLVIENKKVWWDNYIGCVIDGVQYCYKLANEGEECIVLAENLEDKEHSLLLFKRMDGCHALIIKGFIIEKNADIFKQEEISTRRIEVYGDSVSAGEVSEAVDYTGKEDPVHNGEYSNSWYSYAWITARKLKAEIHNISQGGIALLDRTGYFYEPDSIGMEHCFDKLNYHAALGPVSSWDFEQYLPHIVIVAIGQNDSHPTDFMAEDNQGEMSKRWREHYKRLIMQLRERYPDVVIILTTTILNHHKNWDLAIEEVKEQLQDSKTYHFLYRQNGCGTPGHIRVTEAETMADELTAFIESLGSEVWQDVKTDVK